MSVHISAGVGFIATSTATYPSATSSDGTTTAASSAAITATGIVLESVVIESVGGADGTVTIKDHAGSRTYATLPIVVLAARDFHYGCYGVELKGGIGIQAICSDATAKARIVCRWGS